MYSLKKEVCYRHLEDSRLALGCFSVYIDNTCSIENDSISFKIISNAPVSCFTKLINTFHGFKLLLIDEFWKS